MDVERSENEPHDRRTRLCDVALTAMHGSDDYQGEKMIVFLDGKDGAGIGLRGYEGMEVEAVAHLFIYMKALLAAQGKELIFAPLNKG